METIEERAKMQARLLTCKNCTICKYKTFIYDLSENICSLEGDEECEENYAALQAYILSATEQDRIARQEERERCVKAVQKFIFDNIHGDSDGGYLYFKIIDEDVLQEYIRIAMEEGGVE